MTERILITGANGFIGSHVAEALLAQGHQVLGVSLEDRATRLSPRASYRKLDLTCHDSVATFLRDNPVDTVVHLAALVHVRDENLSFADYARVNYRASDALFREAIAAGTQRIVFASTVEVYGPVAPGTVVTEAQPCRPESDYARSKLLAEEALESRARPAGVPYAILRFGPVYADSFRLNLDKRLYLKAPWLAYQLGTGDYRLSLCSIRNIEHWVTAWVGSDCPQTGTYNLADEKSYGIRELLALERLHHRAQWVCRIPMLPSLGLLALREAFCHLAERSPGMYSVENFRKLGRSVHWDSTHAREVCGPLPGDLAKDLYPQRCPATSHSVGKES